MTASSGAPILGFEVRAMTSTLTSAHDQELHRRLERWVAEGLLDAVQADRIQRAEAEWATDRQRLPGRGGLIVEALGYLGGALTILAGFIAVNLLWPDVPLAAQLAFAGIGAVALLAVGAAIRIGDEPAYRRLRSTLWLMSTGCLAAFAGLIGAQVWHLSGLTTTVLTAAITTVYAAGQWWWSRTALQHLVTFVAAATTVGTVIDRLAPGATHWAPGLGIWLLSVLWAYVAYRMPLPPRRAGQVAAAVGALVGAQLTLPVAAGHALALGTVAGLLIGGVLVRRVWPLVAGALGVIVCVPETAVRYLPQSMGVPLAMLTVGLVLVAAALGLARRWRNPTRTAGAR
jgi:hypothetical protein